MKFVTYGNQEDSDSLVAASTRCANCGAPPPPDHPADHRYCAKCAAAWRRGNNPEDDTNPTVSSTCANCGAAHTASRPTRRSPVLRQVRRSVAAGERTAREVSALTGGRSR